MPWINRDIEQIISDLRAEAADQKECVTRYFFQAVAVTGAIWTFMFNFNDQERGIFLYLSGAIVVFMLLSVVRMANHKYTTINRNLGYELHLNRLKDYAQIGNERLRKKMLEIGWEEAMCAWRVAQTTMFEELYGSTIFLIPHTVRRKHRGKDYRWYDTHDLLRKVKKTCQKRRWLHRLLEKMKRIEGPTYHPGNYLRNIHWFLHALGGFSIFIMVYFYVLDVGKKPLIFDTLSSEEQIRISVSGTIILVITLYFLTQIHRQASLRRILQSELLSIQSCAVVWRVVVVCQLLASSYAIRFQKSYRYYTIYTASLALHFNERFDEPHEWLNEWEGCFGSEEMFAKLRNVLPSDEQLTPITSV
jgi:hypothetical protein